MLDELNKSLTFQKNNLALTWPHLNIYANILMTQQELVTANFIVYALVFFFKCEDFNELVDAAYTILTFIWGTVD